MHFRVIFTNDLDGYYNENQTDVTMALTVEASNFDNAVLTAKALLESYAFWPQLFQVVSVQKIDLPEEESIQEEVIKEHVKKASEIWCLDTGIQIMDPDGWRYDALAWDEPITREDFLKRAYMSTCYAWPKPLHDEVEDCGDDSACDEPLCPSYRKYD